MSRFRLGFLVTLLLGSILTQVLGNVSKLEGTKIKCIYRERQLLLKFRENLVDDDGVLSSWESNEDCCKWREIHCDNKTNHVTALDFRGLLTPTRFYGKISPPLVKLQHLNYLDLSYIDIPVAKFPKFMVNLSRLRYLNLSGGNFEGVIPQELGNLTELQFLDLNSFSSTLSSTNLDWLSLLTSLKYLDLSNIDLSRVTNWLPALAKVPFLQELFLVRCNLPEIPLSMQPTINFSSLAILDLSDNYLSHHSIYPWIFNFSSSISYIDLSWNYLQGSIPNALQNMASLSYLSMSNNEIEDGIPPFLGNLSLETLNLASNYLSGELPEVMDNLFQHAESKLKHLDISLNGLNGTIPDSITSLLSLIELRLAGNEINGLLPKNIGDLFNLRVLDLSHNQLSGELPESIGRLYKLEFLYLGSNQLEGIISQVHLLNLSVLRELDLSFNSFQLKMSSGFIAPFQLRFIKLANCKQGPNFPEWLRTQHNFSYIDISGAEISDIIPDWFWELSPRLVHVNFSYNQISGILPDLSSKFSDTPTLDLSSNNLEGTLPPLPPIIFTLNLFQNRLSGSLESLCNHDIISTLDVSDNFLTGQFPDCFQHIGSSFILNLANNNLSGSIPGGGPDCHLWSLNLRNNSFTGELPQSFRNCSQLQVIDLGENKFSGSIPAWIGDNWPWLVVLSLRSNELYGEIPSGICHMANVQILDLSLNKINGTLPKCFNNLTAIAEEGSVTTTISLPSGVYFSDSRVLFWSHDESAFVIWKGVESKYRSTLGLVKIIDLSSNHLTGDIPIEITSLEGLIGLNLSRNFITGSIPPEIGQLHLLNFLDLSRNRLHGNIPNNLSLLTHLGFLDLSYNNLTGRIPPSTQLQTFDVSAYTGNSGLCGKPVTENCPGDEVTQIPEKTGDHNEKDTLITRGFYISLGLGFVFGFLGICGSLLLNRSWRHRLFNVHHWLY